MKGLVKDVLRAAAMILVSSAAAFALNALSEHPLSVWSKEGPGSWESKVPKITVDELRDILRSHRPFVLVDVRSEASFAKAHPASAWNLPADRFTEAYTRVGLRPVLFEAEQVVVLCENNECPAGTYAARLLIHLGHDRVKVLDDGWRAYERSGLEITKQ